MEYRRYTEDDFEAVMQLCKDNEINPPIGANIWVAENEEGEIVGFAGMKAYGFIEPLVSKNPIAGKKLSDKAEEIFKEFNVDIRIIAPKVHVKLYEKLGYRKIFENYIIMEKNL